MLNEPALSHDDQPAARAPRPLTEDSFEPDRFSDLRAAAATIMTIERETPVDDNTIQTLREDLLLMPGSAPEVVYEGRLIAPSQEAYASVDALLAPQDHVPLLRFSREPGKVLLIIARGRPKVSGRSPWVNIALFVATLLSLLFVGTTIAAGEAGVTNPALGEEIFNNPLVNLWRGAPYAIALMLILGAHELGHYFAARRHRMSATLPYFIPLPPPLSLFGTAGAFIQLREPLKNRRAMLDVGAAGPLAGLIFAIPIVLIGLATSPVGPVSGIGLVEGNSLVYALAKVIALGQFVPVGDIDVTMNQLAQAGWTGLLVTAINLIPLGQLDGGHIMYSLVGNKARRLYVPVLLGTIALTLFFSESWLLWLGLLFVFGRFYAVPLDAVTQLDGRRRFIGLLSLIVFVVTFVPVPFQLRVVDTAPVLRESIFALPVIAAVLCAWLVRRR
jgi:membrane-associated protease RseP (regulator of RpoE activity)